MELNEHLQELVAMALLYPRESLERRKYLTEIIRLITNSRKLWRDYQSPYYEDALQQTWQYLSENLHKYDSSKASLISWVNQYLKWRIADYWVIYPLQADSEFMISNIPDSSTESNDEFWVRTLEKLIDWVTKDDTQILRRTHIREHPEANCQSLILRKIQPNNKWKILSTELGISIQTLSSFYQRKCLPLLQEFSQQEDLF
jgi:hypothetical protein